MKYIPIYRVKKSIQALYNGRCVAAKREKIKLGKNSKSKEKKTTDTV